MKKILIQLICLFIVGNLQAQQNEWLFATTTLEYANNLKNEFPNKVEIIETKNDLVAVYVDAETSLEIKNYGNLHGPGFVYKVDKDDAIQSLHSNISPNVNALNFTITEEAFVEQCISMVEEDNLAQTILTLEAYGTRFHNQPSGIQASLDLKTTWEDLVAQFNRDDVLVEFYEHSFTQQKSVIVTIPGLEFPEEIIVIGGHIDSGDFWNPYDAPGADDNASGIATLTETLRILLANDFKPKRTVQIMAYAAEEIGLYGSADIANNYSSIGKNVLAAVQFDMTNYNGSSFDIALNTDEAYTSNELNLFLIELLEYYNSEGEHQITYGSSQCGYGCSDHVSWAENGYHAAFPMEAAFNDVSPYIHTPNDTFASMNNDASHSVKFVKLALEFVIETAKTSQLAVIDVNENEEVSMLISDRKLIYDFSQSNVDLSSIQIFDTSARNLISNNKLKNRGEVSLESLKNGAYIAVFKNENGKTYSKKFLLK